MGDGFLAIFGLSVTREDDAMLAVHAALEILEVARAYGRELVEGHQIHGFDVRVGISTGLVASGGFSEAEDTVMGLTVNLAARLQQAAPPGGVLISHSTYQHVWGAFEVEAQDPIVAKGFADPVPVYLVRQARPRTFRTITRGVPEVETPHVGRDAELQRLQGAFQTAVQRTETHLILIVGEAGIGKSRLLYEFDRWIATDPERVDLFKGRAGQPMMNTPFSLLRDCFAHGLEILDSDPAPVARQKL